MRGTLFLWLAIAATGCRATLDFDGIAEGPPPADDALTDSGAPETSVRCEDVCKAPGSCASGTCVFSCVGFFGCEGGVTCPAGVPCKVECSGQGACRGVVQCNAPSCEIICSDQACNSLDVTSPRATINCQGQGSCQRVVARGGVSLYCGTFACDSIDCSGTCSLDCRGSGSCDDVTCAGDSCTASCASRNCNICCTAASCDLKDVPSTCR